MSIYSIKEWNGCVACTAKMRNAGKIKVGKLEGEIPFGKQDFDGRILLNLILKKQDRNVWNKLI
jgi:hypothetical protein